MPDLVGILDSRLHHDQLETRIDADALAVGADEHEPWSIDLTGVERFERQP